MRLRRPSSRLIEERIENYRRIHEERLRNPQTHGARLSVVLDGSLVRERLGFYDRKLRSSPRKQSVPTPTIEKVAPRRSVSRKILDKLTTAPAPGARAAGRSQHLPLCTEPAVLEPSSASDASSPPPSETGAEAAPAETSAEDDFLLRLGAAGGGTVYDAGLPVIPEVAAPEPAPMSRYDLESRGVAAVKPLPGRAEPKLELQAETEPNLMPEEAYAPQEDPAKREASSRELTGKGAAAKMPSAMVPASMELVHQGPSLREPAPAPALDIPAPTPAVSATLSVPDSRASAAAIAGTIDGAMVGTAAKASAPTSLGESLASLPAATVSRDPIELAAADAYAADAAAAEPAAERALSKGIIPLEEATLADATLYGATRGGAAMEGAANDGATLDGATSKAATEGAVKEGVAERGATEQAAAKEGVPSEGLTIARATTEGANLQGPQEAPEEPSWELPLPEARQLENALEQATLGICRYRDSVSGIHPRYARHTDTHTYCTQ